MPSPEDDDDEEMMNELVQDDVPVPLPPMLGSSSESAAAPPTSPPALDELIPSAEPPMVRPPSATPPPLDDLLGKDSSGQKIARGELFGRSLEDEVLGEVLASAAKDGIQEASSRENAGGKPSNQIRPEEPEELDVFGMRSRDSGDPILSVRDPATESDTKRGGDSSSGRAPEIRVPEASRNSERCDTNASTKTDKSTKTAGTSTWGGSFMAGVGSLFVHRASGSENCDSTEEGNSFSQAYTTYSTTKRSFTLADMGEETRCQRAVCIYSALIVRCPLCFITIYILIVAAIIGIFWRPLEVDTDFSSFIRADGEAMRQRDAYLEALSVKDEDSRRLRRLKGSEAREKWFSVNDKLTEDEADGQDSKLLPFTFDDAESTSEEEEAWLNDFQDPEAGHGRLLQVGGAVVVMLRTLSILYLPTSGNAFDRRFLKGVADFERGLRGKSKWSEICYTKVTEPRRYLCDPGQTFISYAFPSKIAPEASMVNLTSFVLDFNALGSDMLQMPAALAVLQQSTKLKHDLTHFFPKDYIAPPIGTDPEGTPTALRTTYTFFLGVGEMGMSMSALKTNVNKIVADYEEFIKDVVFPYVSDVDEEISEHITVLYHGDVITGYEVSRALRLDALWAVGSIAFVAVYLWFHTGSLVLSLCSLGIIFTSVPLAYVLTPASKTTVASFISLFLITGIGCDVVFVFTDCWEQSVETEKTYSRRLAWVILHAGRNCLATSLTTSASFFANLASALQPLREFGLFMGLCVFSAFFLVTLFMPPLMILRENCRSEPEEKQETVPPKGEMNAMAIVPSAPSAMERQTSPLTSRSDSQNSTGSSRRGGRSKALMEKFLYWTTQKIAVCPMSVAVINGIILLAFIIGTAVKVDLDRKVPDLFPESHNQVMDAKAQEKFSVAPDLINEFSQQDGGEVCYPEAFGTKSTLETRSLCLLHWCEADSSYSTASSYSEEQTVCYLPKDSWPASPHCTSVDFMMRLVSPDPGSKFSWGEAMKGAVLNWTGVPTGTSASYTPGSDSSAASSELNAMVVEEWETGSMWTGRYFDMGAVILDTSQVGNAAKTGHCPVMAICFQGERQCPRQGWVTAWTVAATSSGGRLLKESLQKEPGVQSLVSHGSHPSQSQLPLVGRGLQAAQVPLTKRVDVTVIWGVRAAQSTPLVGPPPEIWSFDPTFEPNNPWAQRAMFAMCNSQPDYLLVAQRICWIEQFRQHLIANRKKRFPTRDLEQDVKFWWDSDLVAAESMWRDGLKVQAAKISFILNVAQDSAAQPMLEHRDRWDKYVTAMNDAASVTANRAFHSASAWVRAEAEIAVIDSTIDTIIIAAVCAWVGMLVFTQDPVLSFLVLGLVLGIVVGLAFFIVVIMDLKIGSIEVISLVIFVGYSVTYSLHVAHSYAEASPPEFGGDDEAPVALPLGAPTNRRDYIAAVRKHRAQLAIVHIGAAVMSSALSTLGSSIFLLCCTMVIFVKLGSVVIAVTFLSILCALVSLPAFLMIMGPPPEPWIFRCMQFLRRTRARVAAKRRGE